MANPKISTARHYELLNTHMMSILETVAALGNVADADDAYSYATMDEGYAIEDLKGWTYVFNHLFYAGLLARDAQHHDDFVMTKAGEMLRRPR